MGEQAEPRNATDPGGQDRRPRAHGHGHPTLPNHRRADLDIAQIRSLHRRQVAIYAEEQRAIAAEIGHRQRARQLTDEQIQVLRVGLAVLIKPDLQRRLEAIDVALTRLTRGSLEAARSHEKIVGDQDDAALLATLREEFLRASYTFGPEEWAMLDQVRATQAREGQKPAFLAARAGMTRLHGRSRSPAPAAPTPPQEDA